MYGVVSYSKTIKANALYLNETQQHNTVFKRDSV